MAITVFDGVGGRSAGVAPAGRSSSNQVRGGLDSTTLFYLSSKEIEIAIAEGLPY